MGAPLFQVNNSNNNNQKTMTDAGCQEKASSASPSSQISQLSRNNVTMHSSSSYHNPPLSTISNGVSSTAAPKQHVNLIKLEVINSAKNRPGEKRPPPPAYEKLNPVQSNSGVNKPPLPPSNNNNNNIQASAANTPASPNIIPFGLAPNAWRSKLKSVQPPQQQQGVNTSGSSNNEDNNSDSENPMQSRSLNNSLNSTPQQNGSNKVQSRIIPIELKNSSKMTGGGKSSTGGVTVQRSLSSVGTSSSSAPIHRNDRFSPPIQGSNHASHNRVIFQSFYNC
jgi:hypothetical protein